MLGLVDGDVVVADHIAKPGAPGTPGEEDPLVGRRGGAMPGGRSPPVPPAPSGPADPPGSNTYGLGLSLGRLAPTFSTWCTSSIVCPLGVSKRMDSPWPTLAPRLIRCTGKP